MGFPVSLNTCTTFTQCDCTFPTGRPRLQLPQYEGWKCVTGVARIASTPASVLASPDELFGSLRQIGKTAGQERLAMNARENIAEWGVDANSAARKTQYPRVHESTLIHTFRVSISPLQPGTREYEPIRGKSRIDQ